MPTLKILNFFVLMAKFYQYIIIVFDFGGVMSFEKNKFQVVKKKRLPKSEFNVECNIPLENEIGKIFSVCHSAQVESAEVLNGAVNYSGCIEICILYQTIDGEISTINSSCPFSSKFEDSAIMVTDKVGIKCEVENYSVDSVTSSNVKINCTVEQSGVIISCHDVETIMPLDDDICTKKEEIYVSTFIGEASEIFSMESEISIKEPIRKVILCESQVSVKDVESGINFVSVSGEVINRILYLTENDRYETSFVTENFKEEVELEGVSQNSITEAKATVKHSQVKCEVVEQEKGVSIKINVPVEIKVCAFEEKQVDVIKDIYSQKEELEVSTSSFDMTKTLQSDYFETKIDGNLTLDDDKPRIDKVLFVAGTELSLSNAYIQNGEIFVEGVAKANVVYLNDEENSNNSVVVEVPFVVSDKTTAPCENPDISVSAILYDVDVVARKGRELFFDGKLKVRVNYDCEEVSAVISSVEAKGDVVERDCSVELVYAKSGTDAWDIAKKFRVSEEMVQIQNPEISFPLQEDASVILYFQKVKN